MLRALACSIGPKRPWLVAWLVVGAAPPLAAQTPAAGGLGANPAAPTPSDSVVVVSWDPTPPSHGSLAYVVVHPVSNDADPPLRIRGTMADEPLHFERDSTGRYRAMGAVPVGTQRRIELPLVVERQSGITQEVLVTLPVAGRRFGIERLSVDPRFTTPPDSALAVRIAREAALVRAVSVRSHETLRQWTGPFERPRGSQVTSRFGTGREFNGVIQSRHLGVDFRGDSGAPVRAANDAVVALVGDFYYSGRIVYLDHGQGLVSAYLHMSEALVAEGERVTRGQLIGRVGSSGRVTGPHLHWNVRYGKVSVDPASLLMLTRPTPAPAPVDGPGSPARP